ncbi:MAG: hypothetical protein P0Y62_09635 [Candidatus Chryseobacterium colombiense]|nr:hypothetical protein [Chryseobacterium sp.]WEK68135.1 MAG: hypothetical protein P0Y62_09635 [Chryseobacterium sp.]
MEHLIIHNTKLNKPPSNFGGFNSLKHNMKKLFILISILTLFTSCSLIQKKKRHYLGTLENVKVIISHEDSIKIDSSKIAWSKRYHCTEMINGANFKGSISTFRQLIYDKFKPSKNAKSGENLVRITIGKSNNLEKAEIISYTDEESKSLIENIFRSEELGKWTSANQFLIPVKQQFEISIFIEKK